MEISPNTPVAQAIPPAAEEQSSTSISSDFETFLKMLTTQMQNQDPLDPVKSEDFAVQLATFSGVEQQVQTNDLLESLAGQMSIMGMSQLSGWVGMEASAPVAGQFDGSPIDLLPRPALISDAAVLVVTDGDGAEVQRVQIPVSHDSIQWNGERDSGAAFPEGAYYFTVESYSDGAVTASEPAAVYTRIVEARVEDGQTMLITESGDEVSASAISGLREPVDPV